MDNQQIVVIDDSPAILLVMRSMLQELGCSNVVTSSNPMKALEKITKSPERYSAIFTDLNMPELDGMSLIKELGKANFRGGVCIISEMETRVIELAARIARQHKVNLVGNIAKPVPLNEIKRTLDKVKALTIRQGHCPPDSLTVRELEYCIEQGLVEPYYQPKVSILNKRVEGLEVLARITKPGVPNAILPYQFIPIAIRHNLLDALTKQLMKRVIEDFPRLQSEFGDNVKVSLNLSPSQLNEQGYPSHLMDTMDEKHIHRDNITLEITEEFALEDTEQLETINRLRMRGFGLSLDDFGTGFTNLNQLRTLPFTEVKIDRTLINDIHQDQFNQVVVETLVQIADKIDVGLIAEGLESFEDLEYLGRKYQDLKVQGYLICKPKPLDSLLYWYHSWAHNA
ncbi:EAL domain-containing response regulator [Vibrio sonorensis]|uniref:EAL domain-containing response regulator n=1 Tax=Vibrio sonorensis TaxID=1004316 RepID=UPI0008D9D38A|nr:EAL domain-containing response regulator [Vibrio sonorensis]